ncbi:MATH domain and coiled-coil domain-containing protein At3g58410-like [Punica granatum]|uniref:MATH domain and coiled-coil domain-containing protein At3g58410-like n=1 Tax=Punica granatum TaxID=22663 RepID=A0A6P8CHI7_PUNGR|nr:MATH domain and coiled-coil domain-containing protein At3g58410-like [Punica granatum]XP_031383532.1 MATH domain and coiled-coil domain-containing protein At3g58410-like [Punica granatum]
MKFAWRIQRFSRLTERKYYSDDFTAGGCKWRLLVFPKGNNADSVSIYLDVPDASTLPSGWRREAQFSLIMVNQNQRSSSTRRETRHTFTAREADWGFTSFKPLAELHTHMNGFLLNDTLIVEAEVDVLDGHPPVIVPEADHSLPDTEPLVVTETNRFESFFSELKEFIITTENSAAREGSGSNSTENDQMVHLISGSLSLEEVEKAKQSLKECLSDLFKLNMKDRLSAALLTLSHAEVGLSSDQQKSIKAFRENFEDFISDFLTFEQDNAEFELQKLARDQVFSSVKKNHEIHLSNRQLLESLDAEEEELKKRMGEVKMRKEKLISDWEILMTESGEAKSNYTAQEKKLAVVEEKKRIAEERMSRSTMAWSSLKAQFV